MLTATPKCCVVTHADGRMAIAWRVGPRQHLPAGQVISFDGSDNALRWSQLNFGDGDGGTRGGNVVHQVVAKYGDTYMKHIEDKWKDHKCHVPGCETTLIFDGHMKVRRNVCAFRWCNFVRIPGFPNDGYYQGCRNQPKNEHHGYCGQPECTQQREQHKQKHGANPGRSENPTRGT
jgi:hypothetical protein